jgi:hypothetical protein
VYRLVALFLALIILSQLLWERGWHFEIFGYTVFLGSIVIAYLPVTRDFVQESGGRKIALALIPIAAIVAWAIRSDSNIALAAAAAIFWSEVVDFGLWTYFKKWGWGTGMLVSDIISTPVFPVLYALLGPFNDPNIDKAVVIRYLALIPVYAFFFFVREPKTFKNRPRFDFGG